MTICVWHEYVWHAWCDFVTWLKGVLFVMAKEGHNPFVCAICRVYMCVVGLIHTCDMSRSCDMTHMCVASFTCATFLMAKVCHDSSNIFNMTHWYMRHDSFICATWLICVRQTTCSYVLHYSFIRVTWVSVWPSWWQMCDMTHSYMRHDSLVCATWLNHACDMFHWYAPSDSIICGT